VFPSNLKDKKMNRYVILLLASFCVTEMFADDPPPANPQPVDEVAKLMDRISQLEARIKTLEERAKSTQAPVIVPQQPLNAPPNQQWKPNTIPPSGTYPPPAYPSNPWTPPVMPPSPFQPQPPWNNSVPDSWKPFNFNGGQYYIIPLDEAERLRHR
jgi:hypothetical protein